MAEEYGKELTELPFYLTWTCPGDEVEHPCNEICEDRKRLVKFLNTGGSIFGNDKLNVISSLHGYLSYLYGTLAEDFILSESLSSEFKSEGALQSAQRAVIQRFSYEGFSGILARVWQERNENQKNASISGDKNEDC